MPSSNSFETQLSDEEIAWVSEFAVKNDITVEQTLSILLKEGVKAKKDMVSPSTRILKRIMGALK